MTAPEHPEIPPMIIDGRFVGICLEHGCQNMATGCEEGICQCETWLTTLRQSGECDVYKHYCKGCYFRMRGGVEDYCFKTRKELARGDVVSHSIASMLLSILLMIL